jgi:hypothetical protein
LDLELARLDALQATFWPAAMAGDLASAAFILKVSTHRSLILGLNGVLGDPGQAQHTVTVVRGSTEEYVAALKAVVDAHAE